MHNLFGDRFLRLFVGDLQHRPKRTLSNVEDQNPEVFVDGAAESVETANEDGHEKIPEKGNHLLNEEERNKKKI